MHNGTGDKKNLFSYNWINEEFASDLVLNQKWRVCFWLQIWLSGRWAQSSKQKPSSIELIQKNTIAYEMSCLSLKGSMKRTGI